MQSTIDVSTAVCESEGIKRAASPLSPCLSSPAEHHQPLPQHEFPCPTDQVCSSKRLRTSDSIPSLKTRNTHATSARAPPSIVWRDFQNQEAKVAEEAQSPNYEALNPRDQMSNMIAKTATPFTSTQHSKSGIEPRGPGEYLKPHGSNFFTKASIETPRGVVDLERVQVDERSPFNLVPWSIATNLDLMLYSGKTLAITIAHHLIQTNQYAQFTIRVAGHNTTITTGVVSGLQTILLGREWIRSVHLLSDFGNQKYYIPIPLAIEVTEEKCPDIVDTKAEAKDVKPVDVATSNEIAEEHDDDSNGQSSQDDGSFSESEPSFDGQNLLDGDTPSDEPPSGDDTLSDGGTSSEGPISGIHEFTPIDEDDEDDSEDGDGGDDQDDYGDEGDQDDDGEDDGEDDDSEDYEDYKGREGKVCDECEGCEECDGFYKCEGCEDCNEYNECEGCEECEGYKEYEEFREGEEDPDDNLQDFMEQHTHLERFADVEQTKEAHRRQSESGEIALPSSNHIVSQEQSTLPGPTRSQVNGVQARITKRQCKEITDILNHISRTPAGQSFKAPVEKLWPECAGAYAAKVFNPIDLGTIQMKVKNNIYPSIDDFRADIVLLYQNSVDFNGIDHIITSTALEVRDTILHALNDMEKGKGSIMLRASTRITGVW